MAGGKTGRKVRKGLPVQGVLVIEWPRLDLPVICNEYGTMVIRERNTLHRYLNAMCSIYSCTAWYF